MLRKGRGEAVNEAMLLRLAIVLGDPIGPLLTRFLPATYHEVDEPKLRPFIRLGGPWRHPMNFDVAKRLIEERAGG